MKQPRNSGGVAAEHHRYTTANGLAPRLHEGLFVTADDPEQHYRRDRERKEQDEGDVPAEVLNHHAHTGGF